MTTTEPRPLSPVAAECLAAWMQAESIRRVSDVATYCGWQPGLDDGGFALWTLATPVGALTVNSTYCEKTIADELLRVARAKYGRVEVADLVLPEATP